MARKADKRPLTLKFRLVVTERMTVRQAHQKLRAALRTGYLPEGIEIHYVDYAKESTTTGKVTAGQIDGERLEELQNFYRPFLAAQAVRVEKVNE